MAITLKKYGETRFESHKNGWIITSSKLNFFSEELKEKAKKHMNSKSKAKISRSKGDQKK